MSAPGKVLRRRFLAAGLLVALVAAFQLARDISRVSSETRLLVANVTLDDSYYYLQIAWNLAKHGSPTFDGVHRTNGVQLLWFGVDTALAMVSPSKEALLRASLVFELALEAICFWVIWRVGVLLRSPLVGVIMALVWSAQVASKGVLLSGMEEGLYALLLWVLGYEVVRAAIASGENRVPGLSRASWVVVLLGWCRVEFWMFAVVVVGGSLVVLSRSSRPENCKSWRRALVRFSGVAVTGLVLQLSAFRVLGGTWLPVSAMIKASSGDSHSLSSYVTALSRGFFQPPELALAGAVVITIACLALARSGSVEGRFVAAVWALLLIALLVHTHLAAVSIKRFELRYALPHLVAWILVSGAILTAVGRLHLSKRAGRGGLGGVLRRTRWPFVIGATALGMLSSMSQWREHGPPNARRLSRYDTSLWIERNLPRDAVVGSWNAGAIGFFAGRRVVNLDGLVNDAWYYEDVIRGSTTLVAYLEREGVTHVADAGIGNRLFRRSAGASALAGLKERLREIHSDGPMRVWELTAP